MFCLVAVGAALDSTAATIRRRRTTQSAGKYAPARDVEER